MTDTPFDLEAPDLDTEAIMREIRARIRERRVEAKARGLDFEAYADGLYPVPPDAVFSRDLYEAVRYVGLGWDKVGVEMALTESRLPLIGGLVQRLRAALHQLVQLGNDLSQVGGSLFQITDLAGQEGMASTDLRVILRRRNVD